MRKLNKTLNSRFLFLISLTALAGCSEREASNQDSSEVQQVQGPALEVEPQGVVEQLPETYPASWFFAHDLNFFNMLDGKVVILDAAAKTKEYKGQLPAGQAASFAFSSRKKEIYVAETLHAERVAGKRRDVLSIYDTKTLLAKARIELPTKRYQGMPFESSFILLNGDSLGLVFNFTPAASVTVVDLAGQKILSEVPMPGCAMMFPAGALSFSTLCGDGTLMTVTLNEDGSVAGDTKTKPFIDIDNNALYIKYAQVGSIRYFPTYLGDMQPIDFSGGEPKLLKKWSLTTKSERKDGWRPGGWGLLTSSPSGEIFILMHPEGKEGSHKDPGAEIWVYDAATGKRNRKIKLDTPAISIHYTGGKSPMLVAFNTNLELDIYSAKTGDWSHKIGGLATETAFGMYGTN